MTAEVEFGTAPAGAHGFGQVTHSKAGSHRADRRQCLAKDAVDEHQGGPLRVSKNEWLEQLPAHLGCAGWRRPRGACDGRHRRKTPLLIPGCRKTCQRKPFHGRATHDLEPLRSVYCGGAALGREILEIPLGHVVAPTSSSSHSYPRASSSSARSLPPDLTIRPADST